MLISMARRLGSGLARFLNRSTGVYEQFAVTPIGRLRAVLEPGDVLLIEGNTRISSVIKYVTQSTWSHAAVYLGNSAPCAPEISDGVLLEADIEHGVVTVPLSKYVWHNTRICRAIGLSEQHRNRLLSILCSQIGHRYDLRNIFDLLRYFFPLMPVPERFRRRMFAFGSSDPTRAICSSMIAQAFQLLGYPILPEHGPADGPHVLVKRHYTHFVPRDFDLSPYFRVVKPTLVLGFDYRKLIWRESADQTARGPEIDERTQ